MAIELTVAICTRNPRADYLRRTLDALALQTLDRARWELLVVDNGSSPAVAAQFDLGWHAHGRHLVEPTLGLTPARLAAVAAARSPLLVFVDDDNVLAPDYLAEAARLAVEWPELGAWGGDIAPEFETPPPAWFGQNWLYWLAVRPVTRVMWSNLPFDAVPLSYGAGMCVRKAVAEHYAREILPAPHRRMLDRTGDSLIGGGDADLGFTAYDLGLGNGLFPSLRLTHLIGSRRLTVDYMRRLVGDMSFSYVVLHALRGRTPAYPAWPARALKRYQLWRIGGPQRVLELAQLEGWKRGHRWVRQHLR
jgi:glycosyltransferase involved in cell wall biosynthesis